MPTVKLDLKDFLLNDGSVDYGKLVRVWRKEVLQWHNTAAIVDLYNEEIEEEDSLPAISVRWWQRMEKENRVPVDKKRRWLIATILNISPLYLGLDLPKPLVEQPDEIKISAPANAVTLDSIGYANRLNEIWSSPYSSSISEEVRVIVRSWGSERCCG